MANKILLLSTVFLLTIMIAGCLDQNVEKELGDFQCQGNETIIYFDQPNCRYCDQMKPYVASLKKRNCDIIEVDIHENIDLAFKWDVRGTPTWVFCEEKHSGAMSGNQLIKLINTSCYG